MVSYSGQMMRSLERCKWNIGQTQTVKQSQSLRQDRNIVLFLNKYIEALNNTLLPNEKIGIYNEDGNLGGRVSIILGWQEKEIKKLCQEEGRWRYENLFLVHRNLNIDAGKFDFMKDGDSLLYDGTNDQVRNEGLPEIDAYGRYYRFFTYDSARGLDSERVICIEPEAFFNYRVKNPKPEIYFPSKKAVELYYHKIFLIALTRAIHHLVIVIRDENSIFADRIIKTARQMKKDGHPFIEIIEKGNTPYGDMRLLRQENERQREELEKTKEELRTAKAELEKAYNKPLVDTQKEVYNSYLVKIKNKYHGLPEEQVKIMAKGYTYFEGNLDENYSDSVVLWHGAFEYVVNIALGYSYKNSSIFLGDTKEALVKKVNTLAKQNEYFRDKKSLIDSARKIRNKIHLGTISKLEAAAYKEYIFETKPTPIFDALLDYDPVKKALR
jgi:hypothetical protein